jgi:hypothetical protein
MERLETLYTELKSDKVTKRKASVIRRPEDL